MSAGCAFCEESFADTAALVDHLQERHREKIPFCEVDKITCWCGMFFETLLAGGRTKEALAFSFGKWHAAQQLAAHLQREGGLIPHLLAISFEGKEAVKAQAKASWRTLKSERPRNYAPKKPKPVYVTTQPPTLLDET